MEGVFSFAQGRDGRFGARAPGLAVGSRHMIDAVLFDLYETLITEAPVAPTRDLPACAAGWELNRKRPSTSGTAVTTSSPEPNEPVFGPAGPPGSLRLLLRHSRGPNLRAATRC